MLSASACQLASTIFSDKPTVPHLSVASPDSISTRTCAPCVARSQHSHLIIDELHFFELGVKLLQCLAHSIVQSIDRSVAQRGSMFDRTSNADHDGCLGNRRVILAPFFVGYPETQKIEILAVQSHGFFSISSNDASAPSN